MTERPGVVRRLRRLFVRDDAEHDLDDEVRFHLDMETGANLAHGMEAHQARRAALVAFGGVQRIKEECRDLRVTAWLDGLAADVRYSLRSLRRSPLFAVVAIGTIALGIGATTTLYSVVEAVLLKSLPYRNPDRLVYLAETQQGWQIDFAVSPANFVDWQRQAKAFDAMAAVAGFRTVLLGEGEPVTLIGARVSANYFEILGTRPARGRTFVPDEDRPDAPATVVLSYDLWVRRFGRDSAIVGRTIRLANELCTVVGIMPRGFSTALGPNDSRAIDIWRPYAFAGASAEERDAKMLYPIARMKAGMSLEQAQEEMDVIARRLASAYPATNKKWGAEVLPMHEQLVRDARQPITLLFGGVCFILLIACVNVASLIAARGRARRAEVAMRRALGAARARLVRQLLTESLLLSALGGVGGVLLARLLLPAVVAASPWEFPGVTPVTLSAPVLLFAAVACTATGILVGLVPALRNSDPELAGQLAEGARGSVAGGRIRGSGTLVVAEVALAIMLLAGAGLLLMSYLRITRIALGFQPDDVTVVSVRLPRERYAEAVGPGSLPETENFTVWRVRPRQVQFTDDALQRMRRIPGVTRAAAISVLPATTPYWRSLLPHQDGTPPGPDDKQIWTLIRPVTSGYFQTMQIPLLAGRRFTGADETGTEDVAIIDQRLARNLSPSGNAVGKTFLARDGSEYQPRRLRVVGVVGSVRPIGFDRQSLATDTSTYVNWANAIYLPYRHQTSTWVEYNLGLWLRMFFVVRTAPGRSVPVADLRRVVREVDPDLPVETMPLTRVLGESMAEQRFLAQLLTAFGILGLVLAVTGIYGVVAYSVTRRVREVGIRMALGARRSAILRLFMGRALRHSLIGLGLGIAGALALGRVLSGFLYQVSARDPDTLIGAAAVLLAATILAAWLPSRRAMRVDPVETLRSD